jgi:hypothetical protein
VFIPVRQIFPHRGLGDIPGAVCRELASSDLASRVKPGARIAVGVGSRGISNIAVIVRSVVDFFTSHGFRPFLFPAMGSHGAATAEGQARVLVHYSIDEATMGCPVVSSFDLVSLGRTDLGIETFAGRDAWESDAIFVVNRVKWHTSFDGAIESGVSKMLALGLGKIEGARSCHGHARRIGMDTVIRSVAGHLLATGRILGGLAILEDAYHETAQVTALPAAGLIEKEVELLQLAKSWMGRIPVAALDVLIVDEIGKNISGTGMDLKVVNRGVHGQYNPSAGTTRIERIFIRDLSELSYGNAVGIGLADVIHDRLFRKVDVNAGRINTMTSGSLAAVRTPLHFPSDRECLELVTATVGKFVPAEITMGWIRNTLDLGMIALTRNLADEIGRNPMLEIAGPPFGLDFDSQGDLPQLQDLTETIIQSK